MNAGDIMFGIIKALLLLVTLAAYGLIYIMTGPAGSGTAEPLNFGALILFLLAWLISISPAIEGMLGKEVQYNPWDLGKNWQRHVVGIGFILAAFYYNFSAFHVNLGLKINLFDPFVIFFGAMAIVVYILNEWIVAFLVNGVA